MEKLGLQGLGPRGADPEIHGNYSEKYNNRTGLRRAVLDSGSGEGNWCLKNCVKIIPKGFRIQDSRILKVPDLKWLQVGEMVFWGPHP